MVFRCRKKSFNKEETARISLAILKGVLARDPKNKKKVEKLNNATFYRCKKCNNIHIKGI